MPRPRRFCPVGFPVHLIQRGNNRQPIFKNDGDRAAYANWLTEGAARYNVDIHGWVFMTNHVHLLLTPHGDNSLSWLMQLVGRLYVRRFNLNHARTGALFEGRFRTSVVQEDRYFLACLRYIELNPVRAGITRDPGDYHWSSYGTHARGVRARMWSPHELYLGLGSNDRRRQDAWRSLVREGLDVEVLAKVRETARTGQVLGSESFREKVRSLRR